MSTEVVEDFASQWRSRLSRCLALVLLSGAAFVGWQSHPEPARAATIAFGSVTAQVSDHTGTSGTSGNCIKYSPRDGANARTTFVSAPTEALTAHGYPVNGSCPSNLSTATQSALGVTPTTATSTADGTPFLLGTVRHYNNPVDSSSDEKFTGTLAFRLNGLTGNNTFSWNWSMWETPNSQSTCPTSSWWQGNSNCQDQIKFTSAVSQEAVVVDGVTYRVVVDGFRVPGGSTCPSTPTGATTSDFLTDERTVTTGCVYVALTQVRSLKIVKKVVAPAGVSIPSTAFGFTSTSSVSGSAWDAKAFTLTSSTTTSDARSAELLQTETMNVVETAPTGVGSDRWALTDISCTDGTGAAVTAASTNLAAGRLTLTKVPAASAAAAPITCTFTNTYTPRGTLTLVKTVDNANGGSATPAAFTLTATGPTTVSGAGNSAAIVKQRVPVGSYALSETGAAGYLPLGWSCVGGTGSGANGTVTVGDGQDVTCTVTNKFQTGSFKIAKVISDPREGFTGSDSTAFTGTYNCGSGPVAFSVTRGTAFVSPQIPVNRTCTVTETTPSGNLKNSSYSWGPPSYANNPVTISTASVPTVTVTNSIVQSTGTIRIAKVVQPSGAVGASGYTGGGDRVFPVSYSCSLPAGTVVTSGSADVTVNTPATVTGVPTGAACTFSETLVEQTGDFLDASYSWTTPSISPAPLTVVANQTSTATVTNRFTRNYADLVLKKVVSGGGYTGTGTPFVLTYDCGNDPQRVHLAGSGAQSQATVSVPANTQCSVVEETPAASLLQPSHEWGTPTWQGLTNGTVSVPVNGSRQVTVTNPTVRVFAKLSVTKTVQPSALGSAVVAGTTFGVTVSCDQPASGTGANYSHLFEVALGEVQTTPDLPVGTRCTVTESAPTGSTGLVDDSYVWQAGPAAQSVVLEKKDTTVAVSVTNQIARAHGSLGITKAVAGLNGVNGAATTFSGTWSCTYGDDSPVSGTWSRVGAGAATLTGSHTAVLLGSQCTVTEDAPSPAAPHPTDSSYVWGAASWAPATATVRITKAHPNGTVTVTNPVRRISGSLAVGKVVTGGVAGTAYADLPFSFDWSCTPAGGGDPQSGTLTAVAGQTSGLPADTVIPAGSACTVTEGANPAAIDPYRWDTPVEFQVSGASATPSGRSVSFVTPSEGSPVTVLVTNSISPRTAEVQVTKRVVDPDGGFTGGTFEVSVTCGPTTYGPKSIGNGQSATFTVPLGATCSANEAPVPAGAGLRDASFAWVTPPTIAPGSVTAAEGSSPSITVTNTVRRVRGTVAVTKVVDEAGFSGVLDAERTYAGTWACRYGTQAVNGTWTVDGAGAATLTGPADEVLLTSTCSVTENERGAVSADPSYVWQPVATTDTTVTAAGPNTMTVTNTIDRLTGDLSVRKTVSGETAGYTRTSADFTIGYRCYAADPAVGPYYEGSVDVVAGASRVSLASDIPRGWTCGLHESAPAGTLLRDASYAWQAPGLSVNGEPGDTVRVSGETAAVVVDNPIRRVTGTVGLTKAFGPGVTSVNVPSGTSFSGTWSCVHDAGKASEESWEGTWQVTGAGAATLTPSPVLPVGTECSATEDDLVDADLADVSWAWRTPQVSAPVRVGASTPDLVVTNDVKRVYSDLTVTKKYVGPAAAFDSGTTVTGAWSCEDDGVSVGSGRWTLPAAGGTERVFDRTARVPAGSVCRVTEDTLDDADLTDGSYTWGTAALQPANGTVTLTVVGGQEVQVTNTVSRVYGSLSVTKELAGGNVDDGLEFTGEYRCRYGTDAPVTGPWSVTGAGTYTVGGILVGSACTVTEDTTALPAPVASDGSFVWLAPIVTPDQVVVGAGEPVGLTVTNTAARLTGSFSITKQLLGATGGVPSEATYTFDYSCVARNGDEVAGTSDAIAVGGLWNGPDVAVGSECTVTENPLPDLEDTSYAWLTPVFSVQGVGEDGTAAAPGGITFTVPSGEAPVLVSARNEIERHTRSVQVDKTVSGTTAGYGGGDFLVDLTCTPLSGDPMTATLTVAPDSSGTLADVPVGSTCSAVEQEGRPDLADPSYRWGEPTVSPASLVVRAGEGPATLTVDNPISRAFGTFTLTKVVSGTGAPQDATYRFTYSCAVPGAEESVTGELTLGQDEAVDYDGPPLPQGSTCEIAESTDDLPTPPRGHAWTGVSWTVNGVGAGTEPSIELTIGDGTDLAVVATNELTRTPGGYRVTKTSDPGSGATVKPGDVITYTVSVIPDGTNPVDDVLVDDDLSAVEPFGTMVGAPQVSQGSVRQVDDALHWQVGTVDGDTPLRLTYRYRVEPDAIGVELRNVVTAQGEVPPTSCAPCVTVHQTKATWDLTKSSDPASGSEVRVGQEITYTLTVRSTSKRQSVSGIVVTDDLSDVLAHATLVGSPVASSGSVLTRGNTLTWQPSPLLAGAEESVRYTVRVTQADVTLRNVVSGTAPQGPPSSCPPELSSARKVDRCSTSHHVPGGLIGTEHDPPVPGTDGGDGPHGGWLPSTGTPAGMLAYGLVGLALVGCGGVVLTRRRRQQEAASD